GASYSRASIWLNGSEIDNQPLSILEAFACGLPVVTTDAGGIPDMVTNERTALLVKQGDYEGLARAALRLVAEPDLAQRLIRHGRDECRRYTWEAVRTEWLELYSYLAERQTERNEPLR